MKKSLIFLFLSLAMVLTVPSCTTMDFSKSTLGYEYAADWAAAFFIRQDSTNGMCNYTLTMIQGRTDSEDNLISSGAIISLNLSAPPSNGYELPTGTYDNMTGTKGEYTFDNNSYIAVRLSRASAVQIMKIDTGSVTVSMNGDEYSVRAVVVAGNNTYTFTYSGFITTTDLSAVSQ